VKTDWLRIVPALLALVLAGSCGGPEPEQNGEQNSPSLVEEQDVLGHTLRLAAYPKRIVSTAPSNTEIVLQLGCGDRLVGVTRYYGYPERVRDITRVGGYYDPSVETIMALKPDLVLVARGISQEIFDMMRDLGLPVFALDTQDLQDLYRDVATVGRLLGEEPAAAALVQQVKAGIAAVTSKTRGLDESARPRVFWIMQEEPLLTAGPGNMITTLIGLAGGRNVAANAAKPWPSYSIETLLVNDPHVIVAAAEGLAGREKTSAALLERLRADPVWSKISAVKSGRVYLVPTDLAGQPTPRVVEGLHLLARHLHPELFDTATPDN